MQTLRYVTTCVVLPALVFSACQPSETLSLEQRINAFNDVEKTSYPVLIQPQFERILQDIVLTINTSDIARDAQKLETRLANPALQERISNYKISAKIPDYTKPLTLGYEDVKIFVPELSASWPRVVLAVTSTEEENSVNQVFLMQQDSARDQYKILFTAGLLGGVTFPAMLDSSIGSVALKPENQLLWESPETVVSRYGQFLTEGAGSQWSSMFTSNVFSEAVFEEQNILRSNENLNVEIFRDFDPAKIVSLSTADSGALVFANYVNTKVISPKERNFSIDLPPDAAVLADASKTDLGVELLWSETVLIYVPPKGEGVSVSILGALQGLVSAAVNP